MSKKTNGAPLRVMELFAGVGGFRLGLEGNGSMEYPRTGDFSVVWSSQFEPSSKRQHASDVYVARWGSGGHSNEDIFSVVNDPNKFNAIAAAHPDVLVGGFPCQDYSVAKPADQAAGLEGKKGVLWWSIHSTLRQLQEAAQPVSYVILENVDRLIKSPTACRGRDFAIILSSLAALGYAVEWRVVNAADYGWPQRRRRVFMIAYHRTTALFVQAKQACVNAKTGAWIGAEGVIAGALPVCQVPEGDVTVVRLSAGAFETQSSYVSGPNGASRFQRAGLMVDGAVWTANVTTSEHINFARFVGVARAQTLGDVVAKTRKVPDEAYLSESSLERWRYLKGAKSAVRVASSGHEYKYSEGALPFPDTLDRASRTVITGEGGNSASRTKHVVEDATGCLRRLTAEELEELNGFPRGFTRADGVSEVRRAFLMGNALVVGIVRALGRSLIHACDQAATQD